MTRPGSVSIVGAGPGDPALLTRKAAACLRKADLVLYDALVDPRALAFAPRARKFFVGKRLGRHSMTQDAIQALMIRAARRGLRVVRLKGGDPFVFGRGGEEALALRAANIPFEIVPGITSAIAAPAAAGIPVTHRGAASAFLVVTGHDDRAWASALDAVQPNGVTLVVLMGITRRDALSRSLIAHGWRRNTPAAIVMGAWMAGARTWRGTLAALAMDEDLEDLPGTIVVGDVAALECLSHEVAHVSGGSSEHIRPDAAVVRQRSGHR